MPRRERYRVRIDQPLAAAPHEECGEGRAGTIGLGGPAALGDARQAVGDVAPSDLGNRPVMQRGSVLEQVPLDFDSGTWSQLLSGQICPQYRSDGFGPLLLFFLSGRRWIMSQGDLGVHLGRPFSRLLCAYGGIPPQRLAAPLMLQHPGHDHALSAAPEADAEPRYFSIEIDRVSLAFRQAERGDVRLRQLDLH